MKSVAKLHFRHIASSIHIASIHDEKWGIFRSVAIFAKLHFHIISICVVSDQKATKTAL